MLNPFNGVKMDENLATGVIGAGSFVGESLISALLASEKSVVAFSRDVKNRKIQEGLVWAQWSEGGADLSQILIAQCISVVPIWILPFYFSTLENLGIKRIVALSSTSRFTKVNSSDAAENNLVKQLVEGEEALKRWADQKGVEWIILRPTLVYGYARDKNITEIANFVRKFGFFPLLGKAKGLRQPIYVDDVANACIKVLETVTVKNNSYNISGKEALPYREMVRRVFEALDQRIIFLTIPLIIFKFINRCIKLLPRYRNWSFAMVQRMNMDLVFGHGDAVRDFGFVARGFNLKRQDVMKNKKEIKND